MLADFAAQEILYDVETGSLKEVERAPVDHGHGCAKELRFKLFCAKGQNGGQKTV